MYSVMDYVAMTADTSRMEAYARAIDNAVKPGAIVLDAGAGIGILALLAAKAGAKRVHAVDPNPCLNVLRELAIENGVADRIVIHPMSAFELQLEEKVDVIVSDLRGSFPLYGYHTEILRDAKERLLVPGGIIIPAEDRFYVSVIESSEIQHRLSRVSDGFECRDLRSDSILRSLRNTRFLDASLHPINASDHLTTAECWYRMQYSQFQGGSVDGTVSLKAQRRGTAHALAIWFEAQLDSLHGYSNEPGRWTVYARTVLPLLEPTRVTPGDSVKVTVRVNEHGDQWAWETTIADGESTREKARFRQATFLGAPASVGSLLRGSATFVPSLTPRGERAKAIINRIDGKARVADLVATHIQVPESQAADEVRELVERYTK